MTTTKLTDIPGPQEGGVMWFPQTDIEHAMQAEIDALRKERDALRAAAENLIADVRRRYPGEELRCPLMIALDAALTAHREGE